MKNKIIKFFRFIYLPLLFLVIQSSCKKDALTNETQTGANTFSCKINGKVFTPCKDGFLSTGEPLFAGYSNNFTTLRIFAKCAQEYPYKFISIELDNFHGTGDYLFSDANNYCTYRESTPPDKYYKSALTGMGRITITKDDRQNFILSGTFEFSTINQNDPLDIMTFSSGRFDLKLIKNL